MSKKERLDKVLSHNGYGTRNEVKKYIRRGLVKVNSEIKKDAGFQVSIQDEILLDDKIIEIKKDYYFMMNKPAGVVSATEDNREKTVIDLLNDRHQNIEVFPVGRLDKDTEGLLILTTDGKLAHELLSPNKHVPKVYYAEIEGVVDSSDIDAFKEGIKLDDGYICKPAILKILTSETLSKVEITITEGKFHQVKRMFLAREKKVIYLKRVQFGTISLDENLPLGEYRDLSETEINLLSGV